MSQTDKRVVLNLQDLQNFKLLAITMVQDLPKIQKQYESVTTPGNRTTWIQTNSYYLYQIDSIKYSILITALKGKLKDDFFISQSGEPQLVLKETVQMKCNTYNDLYTHLLVSDHKNEPDLVGLGHIQKIYVDSVIDLNWKYLYFKSHTGH